MIQAVIFDLYETLVTEFDPDWRPGPSVAERLGLPQAAFDAAWNSRYEARMTGRLPDFAAVLREVTAELGQTPNEAMIAQLRQERLKEKVIPFTHIDPAVLQMLNRLRAQSIKLGLITNAAPEEVAAWPESDLASFFDDMIASYQVGLLKPDAGIYRLACERLAVVPEATAFVGDGGNQELPGAAQASLRPFWATWFLDRWPAWKCPPQVRQQAAPFLRLKHPNDLTNALSME